MRSIADGVDELLDVDDARRFELHRVELVLVEQDVLVLGRPRSPSPGRRARPTLAGAGIDRLHADAVVGLGIDQVEVHVGGCARSRCRARPGRSPARAGDGLPRSDGLALLRLFAIVTILTIGIDQRLDGRAQRHSPPCRSRATAGSSSTSAGAVRRVKRLGSRPAFTWLQSSGIDTVAPGRARGDSGATAVEVRSLRR